MEPKFIMLSEVLHIFKEEVQANNPPEQAQRIINELDSGINRFLLPELGFQRLESGRKMTAADTQAATEFTKTVTVLRLRKARELVAIALARPDITTATRNTYGNRINQFLSWVEQQPYYPSERMLRIQDQCRPPRRLSGRRRVGELPLTSRIGSYTKFSLSSEEIMGLLKKEFEDIDRFMLAPNYPGRVLDPIGERTAAFYLKEFRLALGFVTKYKKEPIPLEALSLSSLVPLVTPEDLEGLTYKQQQDLWRSKELELQALICEYFNFMRTENGAISPRTLVGKLTAFKRIATYLYRHQVRSKREYRSIPIFATLDEEISKAVKVKKKWEKTKTYVANQEHKWITPVEGETVLTTLRREILIPMRLECRPRRKDGAFREPTVIARSNLHYCKWALVLDLPPRRQQDYRTTKIALTCPINKPDSVPAEGYYFPLPPPEEREKNYDGTLKDNYLYKVYDYKGKQYPEGIWVLELTSYKTDKAHGIYQMIVPERVFEDGTTFYQHLEHYLCGWWMPEGKKHLQLYDWWDPQLKGRRGRWVTKGRAEFEPQDSGANAHRPAKSIWRSGYLFPVPKTGEQADGNSFGGSFSRTSYQLVGKRITPHMLRYVWATWGHQVKLSDAELASLAYAMGHSVDTLRKMYERCTPEEKLRPIFEAIDRHLFQQLEAPPEGFSASQDVSKPRVVALVEEIRQLSPEERAQVLKVLDDGSA